MDTVIVWSTDE